MKQILLIIVVVVVGCGKKESPAAKEPVKEPTLGEKLVGAYELDGDIIVFQKNGMMESYTEGRKEGGEYKWKIVDKEVHAVTKGGGGRAWGINPDGSLIYLAVIQSNGNKLYLPRLPKIGNTDYQPYWEKITNYQDRIKKAASLKERELNGDRKKLSIDPIVEIADPIVEKEIRRQIKKYTGELTEADIKRVKNLEFIHSSITNEGVKEVAKLKQLEKLSLSHTKITDEWLKEVIKLPELRGLGLWDTKITDVGLKEVVKLEHLYYLNLGGTKITDAGLKELAKLKNLTDLNLRYTRITEAGLKELAKCKQLEKLHLGHTQITDTTELQKALPNCKISD